MGEIGSSIAEAIRKRTASAAFGTYIFFWASFHWQGIYTTLFTSEDKIYQKYHLLKNEYVSCYFFGWHGWSSSAPGYLWPLILTIVFIWPLPKWVLIHSYRLEQQYKVSKRRVKIEEEEKIQAKKEDLAVQQQKTLQEEIKVVTKRQRASKKDPTIVLEEEFIEFKQSRDYPLFGDILQAVYAHNGDTYVSGRYAGSPPVFQLGPQSLKMADVRGLVAITSNGEKIKLTEKGKYFAGKYDKDF